MFAKLKIALEHAGLSPNEIKFYFALLNLGSATISKVAGQAKLDRSSAYLAYEELKKRGLISEDLKTYSKKIFLQDPTAILKILAIKQDSINECLNELRVELPELRASLEKKREPKITFYDGPEAREKIAADVFKTVKEFFLYTNQEDEVKVFSERAHNEFIKERVKRKIRVKVIAARDKWSEELKRTEKENLREVRFAPSNCQIQAETYIYDNKVAMLAYHENIWGFIVECPEFANTQRNIFLSLWEKLK